MHVTDLVGNEFPLMATSTNDLDLNGNQSLSLEITSNKVNDLFIDDFAQMWRITDHNDVVHKVIYAKKKGAGDRLFIDVKGIPLFFDEFDNDRIYEEYNEHMTAQRCFSLIFQNTNFNFAFIGTFAAVQWEGFGKGESKLELFKRALNRYKAEFRISGNTIYLANQIGRDTSIMYRHKLNASNIVQEIDASGFWTYAKGFGNFAEGEESSAKLIREYTSPLAQVPGIGIRHAPPIYNGNITTNETMDAQLKNLVDESLKISVSADLHDLTKQGYPIAQAELGDRIFLIDERIGLNDEVRVNNISITRDWQGNILDLKIVFGSEGITKRYQSELQTAINRITDLIEGNAKLPFNVLDNAVIQATKALQSARTELEFNNGIIAKDSRNPNRVVLFNSAGIGISDNGGHTFREAITADGFVLSAGAIGQLDANHIRAGELSAISANLGTVNAGVLNGVELNGVTINGSIVNTVGNYPDGGGWAQLTDTLRVHANNGIHSALYPGLLTMTGGLWLSSNEFRMSGVAEIGGATDSGSGSNAYFRHLANTTNYMRLNSSAVSFFVNNVKKGEFASLPKFTVEPTVDEEGNYVTDDKTFAINGMGSMQPAVVDFIRVNIKGKTKVYLNENFRSFVGWYDVFPRGAEVIEIHDDHFIIEGQGDIPIMIVGVEDRKEGIRGYSLTEEVIDQHGCEDEPEGWCQTKESAYEPIIERVVTEDIPD